VPRAAGHTVSVSNRTGIERRANLDHSPSAPLRAGAAVRGILVFEGKRQWKWIWDWGLLQDDMTRKYGYDRLHARYRSQYTLLPTIEFEAPPVPEALHMLLRDTPILPDDNIQTCPEPAEGSLRGASSGRSRFRARSPGGLAGALRAQARSRDALQQLGEAVGG